MSIYIKESIKDIDRREWLNMRRSGIGGSDAGAILGLNPWKSAMRVYLDKTEPVTDDTDSESMRQGRDLEQYVADRFCEQTGKKVAKCNYILRSKEHPVMIANVDRLVVGEKAGLECKTAGTRTKVDYEHGEIPPQYICQCMHYMAVTGYDRWYLAVCVLGRAFYVFTIERDEEEIAALIRAEERFWRRHVEAGREPMPDGSESAAEYIRLKYPEANGQTIQLNDAAADIKRYMDLSAYIKAQETEKKQIAQRLQLQMGDAEKAVANGYLIKWSNVSSKRLDTKRIKSEQPKLYKEYAKENISRRFEIKELKED